jgi:ElaB/YqjD/DUF883 family membrane-anchored ribosome-binding protein
MEKNMAGDTSVTGTNSTGARIQGGMSRASEDAHKKIDSIVDAAAPAMASVSEGAHKVVDKVAGAATQVAQKVEASGQQLRRREERAVSVSTRYVQENPAKSLAIAVGAGFLLSRLLSSR